jgi:hypothetical protein
MAACSSSSTTATTTARDLDGAPDRKTIEEPFPSTQELSPTPTSSTPSLPPSSQRDPRSSSYLTVSGKRKKSTPDEQQEVYEKEEKKQEQEDFSSSSSSSSSEYSSLQDLSDRIKEHLLCARGYSSSTDSKLKEKVPKVARSIHQILFSCLESAAFIDEAESPTNSSSETLRRTMLKALMREYKRLSGGERGEQ